MGQIIKSNVLSEMEKVKLYVDYCNKYPTYYNALERLNIGENSISQLLAWLLDTNWVNKKEYDVKENQIHREFTYEFLKLVKSKETIKDRSLLQALDDTQLKVLAKGIFSEQDVDNIDILLVNEEKKFVCVIENKKRAKFSHSKDSVGEKRYLQIEKYHKYIEEKYSDYAKKFVYLCAEKDDTKKCIKERIVDIGRVPEYIKQNLFFGNQKYDEFKNEKISNILEQLNYTIIEHNELVLILYNILRKEYSEGFENGILKPISLIEMEKLAKKLLNFYTKMYNLEERKISGNAKMHFYHKLSDEFKDYNDRLKLLCQYVEYWELHNDTTGLGDNLYGYSKIVYGEYIYDICKRLAVNLEQWQEILKIAEISKKLQELLEYIN